MPAGSLFSAVSQTVTRRRFVLGGATAATVGSLGIARLSRKGLATVDVERLEVPDAEHALADQELTDIRLSVDVSYEWDGNADATAYALRLKVGSTVDNASTLTRTEDEDISKSSLTGEETLEGSLFNSSHFDADTFSPDNGEIEGDVVVVVEFDVIRDEEVVETAQATDTATLTVRAEELEYDVSLRSNGTWEFESE